MDKVSAQKMHKKNLHNKEFTHKDLREVCADFYPIKRRENI